MKLCKEPCGSNIYCEFGMYVTRCKGREIRILRELARRAKHDMTAYINKLLCTDSNGAASSRMEPLDVTKANVEKMFKAHRKQSRRKVDGGK